MVLWVVLFISCIVFILLVSLIILSIEGTYPASQHETYQINDVTEIISRAYTKNLRRDIDPVSKKYYFENGFEHFLSDFPKYLDMVHEGSEHAQNKTIAVCGLLRDCEELLPDITQYFFALQKLFQTVYLVIVENDSTDTTRKILRDFALRHQGFVYVLCPNKDGINHDYCSVPEYVKGIKPGIPDTYRIKKMASLRNCYLEFLRKEEYFYYPDYVLVVDLDLDGILFLDGIMHSMYLMEKDETLDAVTCNGMEIIHHNEYVYYDTFAHIEHGESIYMATQKEKANHDTMIASSKTQRYSSDWSYDVVQSAFGGAAVYRKRSLIPPHNQYGYSSQESSLSCEHSHLHMNLDKIVVNPRMIFLISNNSSNSRNIIKKLKMITPSE